MAHEKVVRSGDRAVRAMDDLREFVSVNRLRLASYESTAEFAAMLHGYHKRLVETLEILEEWENTDAEVAVFAFRLADDGPEFHELVPAEEWEWEDE